MTASGEYQFVAWVRVGIGAVLDGAQGTARLTVDGVEPVDQPLVAYAAGDVTNLSAAAVVRTVPRSGSLDFEPNLFASIELAHPALPWMVSPPPVGARVTPWIVLVVVEEQAGVGVASDANGRTILIIDAPAVPGRELPDLSQTWAWAHAQTTGAAGSAVAAADLARSRGESRARLVAPRKLEPGKRYFACVVPAFSAGVAAALGEDGGGAGFAWTGAETAVRLPVFYSWRFATGPGGDFASLVKLLQPRALDDTVGHRAVDISAPGWGTPAAASATIEVSGALRSAAWQMPDPPQEAMILGDAILAEIDAATDPPPGQAPTYPPPFYGAIATRAETTSAAMPWQDQLNRDVRQRAAAGLGAAIVRAEQDTLVDAAWRAAGESERANQLLRQGELAAEVTLGLARRHLAPLDDGEVLAIARPLLARMHDREPGPRTRPTLAAAVESSAMPNAALSASLRRLARAGGPLARRARVKSGVLLAKIDARAIVPVPTKALPGGAAGFDEISKEAHEQPRFLAATPAAIDESASRWGGAPSPRRRNVAAPAAAEVALARRETDIPDGEEASTPEPISKSATPDPVAIDEFAAAARVHQKYVVERLARIPDHAALPLGDPHAARPLGAVRTAIEAQWTAAKGIVPQLQARIDSIAADAIGTFRPIQVSPVLDRPLVQAAQAQSPEHVLPGVGGIPANTVALATTDPTVVRAFLVGANEELGRELLWRGFPGALGHTWLRTFWGRVTRDAHGVTTPVPDIDPIESWRPDGPKPDGAELVLVVRGEVLRRYPNALVYAVPAAWSGAHRVIGNGAPLTPAIATTLGTDVALFGFDLSVTAARGSDTPPAAPGWYFVIAEHPSEPRFGLAAMPTDAPATWRDVAWSSVTADDLAGRYLRVDGPLAQFHPDDASGLTWGADAAQTAAITLRRPVRVAIHASKLLG